MTRNITLATIAIVFSIALFSIVFSIQVPAYSNMSTQQAYAQADRLITVQVQACEQAGGQWEVGFSTAGCDINYPAPDTSWYTKPIDNPVYAWWSVLQPSLLGISVATLILGAIWLFVEMDNDNETPWHRA